MKSCSVIEPFGRFLYSSANGSEDQRVFTVDADDGSLTAGLPRPNPGAFGRAIVSAGRFIYVTRVNAHDVVTYTADPETGALAQGVTGSSSFVIDASGEPYASK